jgi:glucose/arabinose dehydrogenase
LLEVNSNEIHGDHVARAALTRFVKDNGDAMGRPVGVAIDKRGALLAADDVGNVVWRATPRGSGK